MDGATGDVTLRFARDGNTAVTGRVKIPDGHTLWFERDDGETLRTGTGSINGMDRYSFGVGARQIQFSEQGNLAFAVMAGDDSLYHDKNMLYLDNAYSGKRFGNTYQGLILANSRSDSGEWCFKGGYVGAYGNSLAVGPPDYGIRLQTNLPDSNSAAGRRDAVQIRWLMTPSNRHIYSSTSAILRLMEHNVTQYAFERDAFRLYSPEEHEQSIVIHSAHHDSASSYTILNNNYGASFRIRANGDECDVLAMSGGDSGRVDANRLIVDYPTIVKWSGALPGTTRIAEFGAGTFFWRGPDAEPAGAQTLYVWDSGDTLYHGWVSTVTQAAP